MKRRTFCAQGVAWAFGGAAGRLANAAVLNHQSIDVIVTSSASTSADIVARLIAPHLGSRLHATMVVENRTGASGIIGMGAAAKAAPNGATVMIAPNALLTIKGLHRNLPFDPATAFIPVTPLAVSTMGAIASPMSSINNLTDFVAAARKRPGAINYGSPGVGTPHHLLMASFCLRQGISATHIPYKLTSSMVTDMAGGRIDLAFMPIHTSVELAKQGRVRVIAVNSRERSPLYPNVMTVSEQGFELEEFEWSCGLFLPAGTPKEFVAAFEEATAEVMRLDPIRQSMAGSGLRPVWSSSAEFDRKVRRDIEKWLGIVRQAGIQPE